MMQIHSRAALASVQDLGRFEAFKWGVGTSGAMDRMALVVGNLLLGNEEGAAAIEMQVFPFEIGFEADGAFALTGADCAATLDGVPVLPWSARRVRAGQTLALSQSRAGLWRGARAYLCVSGGIDVPEVLGSRSTQLRGAIGGLDGRMLHQGDRLAARPAAPNRQMAELAVLPPALGLPLLADGLAAVRVLPAAEHDRFTDASLEAFWSQPYRITPQSDRYGFRLDGAPIAPRTPMELRSHGIVPGVIQVPHGGQPIVQMCEGQPSGGYPKIGTVIGCDLWRLGQAPIGSRVRFLRVDWQEAVAALDEEARWLADLARMLDLHSARGVS